MRALGVGLASLVLAAAAGGATVPADLVPARLTLQASELPGAQVASQGPVHEQGYVAAYQRTFTFRTPNGSSGFRFVQSEALVASTVARATSELDRVRATFASTTGRAAYAVAIAKALKVKAAAVRLSASRTPRVGDHAVELPLSVVVGGRRIYESVLYMQLDRVVSVVVASSVRASAPGETRAFAAKVVGHVDDALKPRSLTPPSTIGDAVVGSVITGTSGDWSGDATLTFQWQRCDAAMSCTDVAGATGQTYAVSDADVGFSLRIAVTAANRFGTATVPSGSTPVVEAPPPPPPPPELR